MKVEIEEGCIGCGFCAGVCPHVFALSEDGIAKVIEEPTGATEEGAKEAAEGCPVSVIILT